MLSDCPEFDDVVIAVDMKLESSSRNVLFKFIKSILHISKRVFILSNDNESFSILQQLASHEDSISIRIEDNLANTLLLFVEALGEL